MPFVEAGDECGSKYGDARPAHRPPRISRDVYGFPPGTEQKKAQQTVAENVSAFADKKVPVLEAARIDAKQIVQQRIQNPAGVVG